MNRLLTGFKHKYPQEFLDQLAKDLGFEWIPVKFETIPYDKVEVKPLPPPNGKIYYMEVKYNKNEP